MGLQTARLLPRTGVFSPLGLHLVLAAPSEGEPASFVPLSHEDERTRVLVAAIKGDGDTVVELAALKLLRDAFLEAEPGMTNRSVEERWRRERERIAELGRSSRGFPRLLRLDLPEESGKNELPPLFYCRSARGFFTPPCPRCFASLATCRDDGLLSASGLPPYSSTLERFLHCPRCRETAAPYAFYSVRPPARAAVRVGTPDDLVDALGRALLSRAGASGESFPCSDCLEAARAAPESDAGRFGRGRWSPFCVYDTPYLLTGLSPLTLDEFADAVGGRPLSEVRPAGLALPNGLAARHASLGEEPSAGSRLLFAGDGSGLDAVEVLALRLAAFRQVARALHAHSRLTGEPHLALQPRHVLVELHGAGAGLPALWSFEARLFGLASARRETVTGLGDLLLPPASVHVPYAAPEAVEFQISGVRQAELVFTGLQEARRAAGGWLLQGRLADPYGIYPVPRESDHVLLSYRVEPDGGLTTVLARPLEGARPDPKELPFTTDPAALAPEHVRRVERALGARLPYAHYKVYPDFSVAPDLHALGVLLLRLLLVNDGQDILTVTRGIGRLFEGVQRLEGDEAISVLKLAVRDPRAAALLDRSNVFTLASDRGSRRPNAIPRSVWEKLLTLACRLLVRLPGAPAEPAPGASRLDSALAWVLEEADALAAQLSALLFQRQGLNLEIQQVLAEALEEAPGSPG